MKIQLKLYAVVLSVAILSTGCARKRMAANDYQNYIMNLENGIRKEHSAKGIRTDISLEPLDWQAFKVSYADKQVDNEKFTRFKKENEGMVQFSFKIFLPNKQSLEDYLIESYDNPEEAKLYAEYNMKDDFTLVTPKEKLRALAVHHQPSFGIKPYEEFIVLFDTNDNEIEDKSLELVYNDHLFDLKSLSYSFSEESMKNIPVLSIH